MAELLPWIGGISTAIAAVLGAYATIKARHTETQSADREETQQALDAQAALLNRYETRIEKLEQKVDTVEHRADDAIAAKGEFQLMHQDCERRLRLAEARIAEMGG